MPCSNRLVHHNQNPAVLGEFVEDLPQFGLGVDQRRVVQPLAISAQRDGVVAVLANVEPEKHLVIAVHIASRDAVRPPGRQSGVDCRQPRYEETYPRTAGGRVPISGPPTPPGPATTPPGSCVRQGQ
jgi:hypothetical protein